MTVKQSSSAAALWLIARAGAIIAASQIARPAGPRLHPCDGHERRQRRAAKHGLRCLEVPVRYRRRIGQSKVSGTFKGTVKVSAKILYLIAREAVAAR